MFFRRYSNSCADYIGNAFKIMGGIMFSGGAALGVARITGEDTGRIIGVRESAEQTGVSPAAMTWIIALFLLAGGVGMYRFGKVVHSCCECERNSDSELTTIIYHPPAV